MQHGFILYIDEAGDEGLERVRPIDNPGASEYFVLSGVLIRSHRRPDLAQAVASAKKAVGLEIEDELHFRKLDDVQQATVIKELANFKAGLIAIVSNKRNMRGYRNRRVEAKSLEVDRRGHVRPQSYNWFYNHTFRYLLERASAECAKRTKALYGCNRSIRVVFSHRKNFRYSQTQAYLHKLRVQRHPGRYFNDKRSIAWSVVDASAIENLRARVEPGLQFADCIASAVYRAIDEDWFGTAAPQYLAVLAPRFLRENGSAFGYGFTLLPENFRVPLSAQQVRALQAVGWRPRR